MDVRKATGIKMGISEQQVKNLIWKIYQIVLSILQMILFRKNVKITENMSLEISFRSLIFRDI